MFRVILPSHVPGLLCQAHQTPCLLFRVTSPSSAGPALPSLSARCFRLLRGPLMFVHTAEIHLSAKPQSVQLPFLSGLETWQMGPTWVGFHCSQLRYNLGCLAICTLPQGCGAGGAALAGVSQAMAKSEVCKMLVMPGTYPSMADGKLLGNPFGFISSRWFVVWIRMSFWPGHFGVQWFSGKSLWVFHLDT